MKKIILFLFVCGVFCTAKAQLNAPELVSSGGSIFSSDNISLEWSLGEVAVTSIMENEIQITQGFHQTYPELTSTFVLPNKSIIVDLFPNPSSGNINLNLSTDHNTPIFIHLFSSIGQNLQYVEVDAFEGENKFMLDISEYPVGIYWLRISTDKTGFADVIKVQKINK